MSNNKKGSADNGPASDDTTATSNLESNRSTSSTSSGSTPVTQPRRPDGGAAEEHIVKDGEKNKEKGTKTLWVTVFKCFHCGKHGHNLPKCRQCSQAYYCNADCQRKHWKKHKPVCRAAVAALARRATRERLARAVREKGKDMVEHSADDELCVICQDTTVDPVEVSVWEFTTVEEQIA